MRDYKLAEETKSDFFLLKKYKESLRESTFMEIVLGHLLIILICILSFFMIVLSWEIINHSSCKGI